MGILKFTKLLFIVAWSCLQSLVTSNFIAYENSSPVYTPDGDTIRNYVWHDLAIHSPNNSLECLTSYATAKSSPPVKLHMDSKHFEYIPRNLFHCANVRILFLQTKWLREIAETDFDGGFTLTHLFVFESNIEVLSANGFRNLPNLVKLWISDSPIEVINRYAFVGLTNLKNLWLEGSNVRALHPELFVPLVSVNNVVLLENKLTALPLRLFSNNSQLRWISLRDNFTHFDDRTFPSSLRTLSVQYGDPLNATNAVLNFMVPAGLRNLQIGNYHTNEINFSRATLQTFTINDTFAKAVTFLQTPLQINRTIPLLTIDCSHAIVKPNNGVVIRKQQLQGLQFVNKLAIKGCDVQSITCGAFARLPNLQEVDVENYPKFRPSSTSNVCFFRDN